MLSDREREKLCEIERGLAEDDPRLVEKLQTADWPAPKVADHWFTALLAVSGVLAVASLALGHTTGGLACALVAGWAWGTLHRRKAAARGALPKSGERTWPQD
ncbi:Protein of unknown function [Lentzea fradiae]|uniref:DUF3040 domain-containing protein n=1 Tax=Lentzea fradiae TaxID=200378 RepID=A0A1G7KQ75_9PSEU|nr:DUF3040 domain-containing protein [Lentzea fradiae]SDF39398.1 Protein of unknown function [Lentzea fradiae]